MTPRPFSSQAGRRMSTLRVTPAASFSISALTVLLDTETNRMLNELVGQPLAGHDKIQVVMDE